MSLISRKLLTPRVQELGKIKLGGKGPEVQSSGGKTFQPPVKFAHFVVTTRERGADNNFLKDEQIHAHPNVGKEPKSLDAVLMFETPAENFHAEMVVYKGKKKVWSCNGEEAKNLENGACGACPRLEGKDCKCKPYSRLHLQLLACPTLEGYHVFRTTSWESTNNIQTALERLHSHFGTLLGLPVQLVTYPATVSFEQGGQSKSSKAMMAGLVLAASFEDVSKALIERNKVLQLTRTEVKQLAARVESSLQEIDEEEAGDIAVEYFPDESAEASVRTRETLDDMKSELGVGNEPKTIDAEFEIEDEPEGGSEVEDEKDEAVEPPARMATESQVQGLKDLIQKAREAWAIDMELESIAETALSAGTLEAVRDASKKLSTSIAQAQKEAANA